MSKTGTRDTNIVPKSSVQSFVILMKKIETVCGTVAAINSVGASRSQWYGIMHGNLNIPISLAKRILAKYKEIK